MNIIICGAGRVGFTIAKILSEQGHSITIIDQSSEDIQKIDDSLDVFPVHGIGGILGILMLSLVGKPEGFAGSGSSGFDNTALSQLLIQAEGIIIICIWTAITTYIILKTLNIENAI